MMFDQLQLPSEAKKAGTQSLGGHQGCVSAVLTTFTVFTRLLGTPSINTTTMKYNDNVSTQLRTPESM
jgi:hypothetical protein